MTHTSTALALIAGSHSWESGAPHRAEGGLVPLLSPRMADDRAVSRWSTIGAHRSSRTTQRLYVGVKPRGVWKTTDYGHVWAPIFDTQPTDRSEISPSHFEPERIYVGSGEGVQRPDCNPTGSTIH